MLFIGDDWAEGHHDVVVQDDAGKTLARRRLPEGVDGLARFHELAGACWGEDSEPDPAQVVVVIETDNSAACPRPLRPGQHEAIPSNARFDPHVAHPARVYNLWLGGKDGYAVDREAAGEVAGARANRAFLARVVRYLAAQRGILQFLDIGTGLPAPGSTYEVAQAVVPESRVVYVDNDPQVLSHARALLGSGPRGVAPGVVPVAEWRPDAGWSTQPADLYAGVASTGRWSR